MTLNTDGPTGTGAGTEPVIDDTTLDSGALSDTDYLAKLGYKQELNRALGLFSSFGVQFSSIAVGSAMYTTVIVGLGFFGPASFWSYLVGGILQVFFVGWAVAELVSAYPLSGGTYQIVNRITKKPFLGWQGGWWLVIAHTVSITALAVSIVPFITAWFGVEELTTTTTTLWAVGLIVIATLINLAGVKVAAAANNVGVAAEIGGLVLIVGALLLVKHDTQPLSVLSDSAGTAEDGWFKPFLFAMILPAYLISSFDATGNAAEETKDAARNAPLGTFIANLGAYFAGLALIFLMFRAIPNVGDVMGSGTPAKDILESAVGSTVTSIFEALAIVALVATMAILQLTGVRVLWSQARDGQMPAAHWMRKVNARQIPVNATIFVALLAIGFALWSSLLSVLAAIVAMAWALAYGLVVIVGAWAVLNKKLPARPFSTGALAPLIFGVSVIWSVILCVLLVWGDPKHVGVGMAVAVGAGVVLYFLIPAERRGKVPGVTAGATTID